MITHIVTVVLYCNIDISATENNNSCRNKMQYFDYSHNEWYVYVNILSTIEVFITL